MGFNYCMGCMSELNDGQLICPKCGYDNTKNHNDETLLSEGTILNGKYMVGRVLGRGGFGVTYIGIELNLKIKVAIKEYFPNGITTRQINTRQVKVTNKSVNTEGFVRGKDAFQLEAQTLAMFNSQSIAHVREYFLENNTAYIVMDFVDGKSLSDLIKELGGKMPWQRVISLFLPLMPEMDRLHKKSMIHRDIKPDNLKVVRDEDTGEERLVLLDFGAARSFSAQNQTKTYTQILTPGYAPYEQYQARTHLGPFTDVYALCATMYGAITGQKPPAAPDRMIGDDDIQSFASLGLDVPMYVEKAIAHGLEKRYADRPQTMIELYHEFKGGVPSVPPVREEPPVIYQREDFRDKPDSDDHDDFDHPGGSGDSGDSGDSGRSGGSGDSGRSGGSGNKPGLALLIPVLVIAAIVLIGVGIFQSKTKVDPNDLVMTEAVKLEQTAFAETESAIAATDDAAVRATNEEVVRLTTAASETAAAESILTQTAEADATATGSVYVTQTADVVETVKAEELLETLIAQMTVTQMVNLTQTAEAEAAATESFNATQTAYIAETAKAEEILETLIAQMTATGEVYVTQTAYVTETARAEEIQQTLNVEKTATADAYALELNRIAETKIALYETQTEEARPTATPTFTLTPTATQIPTGTPVPVDPTQTMEAIMTAAAGTMMAEETESAIITATAEEIAWRLTVDYEREQIIFAEQTRAAWTDTPTITPTFTDTPVPTATFTDTPVPTATNTDTPLPTATNTDTPLPTATNTNTPVPTATYTGTPVPTAVPTDTPVPTATPTDTPVPTATMSPTPVVYSTPDGLYIVVSKAVVNNPKDVGEMMYSAPSQKVDVVRTILNGNTVTLTGERRPRGGIWWAKVKNSYNQTGWMRESVLSVSSEIETGNTFTFGTWEQDSNMSNGPEAIEWQVLAVEDDRILVISRYGLDVQPYNNEGTGTEWEASALREWMNEEFLSTAFNSVERARILPVTVISGSSETDRIYQIDINDVYKYFTGDDTQKCSLTAYAVSNGANANQIFWRPTYIASGRTENVIARPAFWMDISDLKGTEYLMMVTPTANPVLTLTPLSIVEILPTAEICEDCVTVDQGSSGSSCHMEPWGLVCD